MKSIALIIGVTGQDGSYLAKHLIKNGYEVYGSSRDKFTCDKSKLINLGISKKVKLISIAPNDFRSVIKAITSIRPTEVYNLSGQTSVGLSFEQPVECLESISSATLTILEAIRFFDKNIRFFNAGSSDCFGDTGGIKANEKTPFGPTSPYSVAKCSSFWQVSSYRKAYNLFACTGILSNHESPFRSKRFVTKKIILQANEVKNGIRENIELNNLDIWRDWGWAPDYVEAMHLMLQNEIPEDFIIATGKTFSLKEFTKKVCNFYNLDFDKIVRPNSKIESRPADFRYSSLDASLIYKKLGWHSKNDFDEIINEICKYVSKFS